jgi:hypothetical protein
MRLSVPIYVERYEALVRRLPESHPKWPLLNNQLANYRSGITGESTLDFSLKFLAKDQYTIVKNIRLPDLHGTFFQMDRLLITQRFIVILEVKNYAKELYLDYPVRQLVQSTPNEKRVFDCPILQVNRQAGHLKIWLKKHRFPDVPIETLVVFSHPSAIIRIAPRHKEALQKVMKQSALLPKIQSLESRYHKEPLAPKEPKKISKLLMKENTPLDTDLMKNQRIDPSHIIRGVHCPGCFRIPMVREKASWHCKHCGFSHKNAHLPTLVDYYLLFGKSITNRNFREMLLVESRSVAVKLIKKLEISSTGNNKGRIYELSYTNLKETIEQGGR